MARYKSYSSTQSTFLSIPSPSRPCPARSSNSSTISSTTNLTFRCSYPALCVLAELSSAGRSDRRGLLAYRGLITITSFAEED